MPDKKGSIVDCAGDRGPRMDADEINRLILQADDADHEGSLRRRNKLAKVSSVLDAANALFAERGYESATMDDIADKASVSSFLWISGA